MAKTAVKMKGHMGVAGAVVPVEKTPVLTATFMGGHMHNGRPVPLWMLGVFARTDGVNRGRTVPRKKIDYKLPADGRLPVAILSKACGTVSFIDA